MTAHPNSSAWCLRPPRKRNIELRASAPKPNYAREMTQRAEWVAEYWQAVANGKEKRARELEGLLGTIPISELEKKG